MRKRALRSNPHDELDRCRFFVSLDTNSQCNLRCLHCWIAEVQNQGYVLKDERMPFELFQKICNEFKGRCSHFALSCSYEPLLNPEFDKYMTYAVETGLPDIHFYTNGKLLTPEMAARIVELGIARIAFSLESVRPDEYAYIRRGASIDDYTRGLDLLRDAKQAAGKEAPRLEINWTPMPRNVQDLDALPDFAAQHGVNTININLHMPLAHDDLQEPSIDTVPRERLGESLERMRRRCRELGIQLFDQHLVFMLFNRGPGSSWKERLRNRLNDLRQPEPHCIQPWNNILINPSGRFIPCNGHLFNFVKGDFSKETLEEIWNREDFRELRASLKGERPPLEHCKSCGLFGQYPWKPNKDRYFRNQSFPMEALSQTNPFLLPRRRKAAAASGEKTGDRSGS